MSYNNILYKILKFGSETLLGIILFVTGISILIFSVFFVTFVLFLLFAFISLIFPLLLAIGFFRNDIDYLKEFFKKT